MSTPTTKNTSARMPRWVNNLLVIVIGYALATLSIKMLPAAQSSVDLASGSPAEITQANKPSIDKMAISKQIAARHLFGDATVKVVEKPKPTVKKPATTTKLNLKLVGVFAYEPQEKAMAIIGTASNEESAFRVGDKVIGEVTLKAVYTDRVILNNRGRDEVLRLPENVTPIATRRPVAQAASQSNRNNAAANQGPVELPTTPGALRDTLAKNPSMLGRVVAAEPYQVNGKLVGYRIIPKQNPEILEAQGIIAGDIITKVNNIELNSQKQGVRALRNAVKAQTLDVTILRDGVEVPLSISLAE